MNYTPPFISYFLARPVKTTVFTLGPLTLLALGPHEPLKSAIWLLAIGLQPILLAMSLSALSTQNKVLLESSPNPEKAYLLGTAVPYQSPVLRNVFFFSADLMRQWLTRQALLRGLAYLTGLALALLDIHQMIQRWSAAQDTVLLVLTALLAGFYLWRSLAYAQLWRMAVTQQWQVGEANMAQATSPVVAAYLPPSAPDDHALTPYLMPLLDPDWLGKRKVTRPTGASAKRA